MTRNSLLLLCMFLEIYICLNNHKLGCDFDNTDRQAYKQPKQI
jgi:hypothetical protein